MAAARKPKGPIVTVLDVLDELFGGVPDDETVAALTLELVDALGQRVNAAADRLAQVTVARDPIGDVIYPGGWLSSGWAETLFRPELNQTLLYQPRLLLHDPLAEYFFSDFDSIPR